MNVHEIAYQTVVEHEAIQRPLELAELLVQVQGLQPATILEIGSYKGGMLWAFRQVCPAAKIVALDPNHEVFMRGDHRGLAECIDGHSYDPEARIAVVEAFEGAEVDFVLLDADHAYEEARRDWEDYGILVRSGGLFVFHDVEPNPDWRFGVDILWQEIRAAGFPTLEIVARDLESGRIEYGIGVVRMP